MPMPTVVSVGAVASGAAAITPALPAGQAAGDILLLPVETENQVVTPPAGYAIATSGQVIVSTGTVTRLTVLWKRATGTEAAPTIADPGDHAVGRMIAIRGCVTTGNPWNAAPVGATETVSDTSVSCPAITTTAADCLVVNVFSTGTDVASTAHVSGWANASLAAVTERMDNWVTSGLGGGLGMATGQKAAAGAVSATTATIVTANFKALFTIALQGEPAIQALASAVTASADPAADLAVLRPLADPGTVTVTGIGSLAAARPLAGSATAAVSPAAALGIAQPLASAATVTATASGVLSGAVPVAGVSTVTAAGTGALRVAQALTAAATVIASQTAALAATRPLAATVTASAAASADLNAARPLTGTAQPAASAAAALPASRPLTTTATVTVAASGGIDVQGQVTLTAASIVTATASATLAVTRPLASITAAAATPQADLTVAAGGQHALTGSATPAAAGAGQLAVFRPATATSIVTAAGQASLTVTGAIAPSQPRWRAAFLHRRAAGTRLARTPAR